MTEPRELILLSRAEKVLTQANTIDEVKDLRDKAVAVKAYAKKAKIGQRIVVEAAAIKLRAERRLGQMLHAIELADAAPGNQYTGRADSSSDQGRIYLRDLGITKSDSSRTQRIAVLPQEIFDRYLSDNIQAEHEPTVAGLLRMAAGPKPASSDRPKAGANSHLHSAIVSLIGTGTRFSTVYADPPWARIQDQQGRRRGRRPFDLRRTMFPSCARCLLRRCPSSPASHECHLTARA